MTTVIQRLLAIMRDGSPITVGQMHKALISDGNGGVERVVLEEVVVELACTAKIRNDGTTWKIAPNT